MMILPKLVFLFQIAPILCKNKWLENCKSEIANFIWQGRKPRIKFKLLTDNKTRGGMDLPNIHLYYDAACLMWIKEWMVLKNSKLLALEGHDLRWGFHAYMWEDKTKQHKAFECHIVRKALLRIWKKYKYIFYPKKPLWFSPLEAMANRQLTGPGKWWSYEKLLTRLGSHYIVKDQNTLNLEGLPISWFPYRIIREQFLKDKSILQFEEIENKFEQIIFFKKNRLIGSLYKVLLEMDLADETVKDTMIKWSQMIKRNICLAEWEALWRRNSKYTISSNIRENFFKMFYRWYITPSRLAKFKLGTNSSCWKCKKKEGTFIHAWWDCKKARHYWRKIQKAIKSILDKDLEFTPDNFLLNLYTTKMVINKDEDRLIWHMLTAAKILYAKYWKSEEIPSIKEWLLKITELAHVDKLTCKLRKTERFGSTWNPLIDYIQLKLGELATLGFRL